MPLIGPFSKPPEPQPEPSPVTPVMPDKVTAWRQEVLERAGFDRDAAMRLAEAKHVDLHQAVEILVECDQDLALRILL